MATQVQPQLYPVELHPHLEGGVTLTLPARPENVTVIRQALCAYAKALRLPDALVEDLRLAVTEACTNVVRHAYAPGDPGPVEVSLQPDDELVRVVVGDQGRGPGTTADPTGPGLGLPLIAAIADTVDFRPLPGGGTRLVMTFPRERAGDAA